MARRSADKFAEAAKLFEAAARYPEHVQGIAEPILHSRAMRAMAAAKRGQLLEARELWTQARDINEAVLEEAYPGQLAHAEAVVPSVKVEADWGSGVLIGPGDQKQDLDLGKSIDVNPGTYTVRLKTGPGFDPPSVEVTVAATEEKEIALEAPELARAPEGDDEVLLQEFERASAEFHNGKFERCGLLFEEINRNKPSEAAGFNAAACWRRFGRVTSAWQAYREVAERFRGDPRYLGVVGRAETLRDELYASLVTLHVELDDSSVALSFNGRGLAPVEGGKYVVNSSETSSRLSTSFVVLLDPHRTYRVVGRRDGRADYEETIESGPAGTEQELGVEFDLSGATIAEYTAWSLAGASLLAGLVTFGVAHKYQSDLGETCLDTRCPPNAEGQLDTGKRLRSATVGLGLAAAACVAVAFVIPVASGGDGEPRLEAFLGPMSGGLGVSF